MLQQKKLWDEKHNEMELHFQQSGLFKKERLPPQINRPLVPPIKI